MDNTLEGNIWTMKKATLLISGMLLIFNCFCIPSDCSEKTDASIGLAVEFMDHAAAAYISQYQGWFEEAGLDVKSYESHVTAWL